MQRHFLVVDGNSIFHANHNSTVLTVGNMQVQAIFGTLRSLQKLMTSTPGAKQMIVLWDGKADFRYELFPEYKGNREAATTEEQASKDARRQQAPFIEKAIELLGIAQLRCATLEADDLAGIYVPKVDAMGTKVTMVSGDGDWLQLVSKNVSWFDPIRNRRVGIDNFLEYTGYYTTEAFVQGKALTGDTSDYIDGINKLGDVTAQLMLAQWKDIAKFFEAVDSGKYTPKARASKTAKTPHPEQALSSPEGRSVFMRNMKLMDWRLTPPPPEGGIKLTLKEPNVEAFKTLCERLAFSSILRNLPEFLRAFNIQHRE